MVLENIHNQPTTGGYWKFQGGGRNQKLRSLKRKYEHKLEFLEEWGQVSNKKTLQERGMDIF